MRSTQQPPQPPAQPQAQQNPFCSRLEAQLQAFDRGGNDAARAEQLRKFEEAAANQQAEIDRQEAAAQRAGCEKNSFFVLFSGQPAQCGPLNQQDPADAGQPRPHPGRHRAAARRSRRPSAKVSAAPSWWRWRRTTAARSISSRWRRRRRRAAAACSNRCSGRSRSSRRAAAATRRADGAERHLPHRLRAHLRRLLLSDLGRHQRRAALPRTKRPAASPARPPRCSSTPTAIRARTSTRRCRSAASSPTRRCRMRSAIARRSIRAAVAGAPGETWSQALKNIEDTTVEQGDIVVNDQRARQLSQPRVDAQGKPIRQAPVAPPRRPDPKAAARPRRRAPRSPPAATATAADAAPADDGPSKPDPEPHGARGRADLHSGDALSAIFQKSNASVLLDAPGLSSVRSGSGSGVPVSRKRLTIG